MSHEYGFGVEFFFLSVPSLISLGLIRGDGTGTLVCLISLPESWFSPWLRFLGEGGLILGLVLIK